MAVYTAWCRFYDPLLEQGFPGCRVANCYIVWMAIRGSLPAASSQQQAKQHQSKDIFPKHSRIFLIIQLAITQLSAAALDLLDQLKNTMVSIVNPISPPTKDITRPPACWSGIEEGAQISRAKERDV